MFAGTRLGLRWTADGSGAVERATETGDGKKEGVGVANRTRGFGSRDLKDWDGDSCSREAQKTERTGGHSACPGSGVLSIAVVLKTLQELLSSLHGPKEQSAEV